MNLRFYRHEDGRITSRMLGPVHGPYEVELPAPAGACEIPAEVALAEIASHEADRDKWVAEQERKVDAQQKADYDELLRLGMNETTARRLTGYQGKAARDGH
ncbi:hypothetical protein [Microtetraspora malaysiensis]|uniref:Uncharacterized protein n=1 Tax=Microtetraspora malaysiensis TaxID=161358 RepID=A0ABW6SKJ4_9ACTN